MPMLKPATDLVTAPAASYQARVGEASIRIELSPIVLGATQPRKQELAEVALQNYFLVFDRQPIGGRV